MSSSQSTAGVSEGDLLAGKYRVDRILGAGGMGVVVAAHHLHLDLRVAIKFLLPELLSSVEAVQRFAREARAAAQIKSEHVARVLDVGTLENGAPYLVMEYLDGEDLANWLKQRGVLALEQAIDFVLQACEAIAEAHTLGIVHRDLKPANLFVIRRPDGAFAVKVLDFGISKMQSATPGAPDSAMTKTSAMMGSPVYMSPEQLQSSKDVDVRTDVWALGIILYELLAGQSPFHAESMPELIAKILSTPPPSLREKRPDLPPGFEPIILRCLEKERARRYASVSDLSLSLARFAPARARLSLDRISGLMNPNRAEPSSAAVAALTSREIAGPATHAAFGHTHPNGANRTAKTLALTAVLVLSGLVISLFWFFRQPSSPGLAHNPFNAPTSGVPNTVTAAPAVPDVVAKAPESKAAADNGPAPAAAASTHLAVLSAAPLAQQPSAPVSRSKVTRSLAKTGAGSSRSPLTAQVNASPPAVSSAAPAPRISVEPSRTPSAPKMGAFDDRN